jgi:hypothetical protein
VFVREKKNITGTISVQVIDKSRGKYRVVTTIGSSADKNEIDDYVAKGKQYIVKHSKQISLDFELGDDAHF